MKYYAHLFLNNLPYIEEEVRYVAGEKQVCLVIPTSINQIKRGRQGNWLMSLRLVDALPNPKLITHNIHLICLNQEEVDKARQRGYYERIHRLGRVRVMDDSPEKKIDRRNKATDIKSDGIIILSDIPKQVIFRNAENNNRYIKDLIFRSESDRRYVYSGVICIDDIPTDEIKTDPNTGKKYINTRFQKLKYLDTYMNTHQLVIVTKSGDEIEIGKFKEWVAKQNIDNTPPSVPPSEPKGLSVERFSTPDSIDGIRF